MIMKRLQSVQNSARPKDSTVYSFGQPLPLSGNESRFGEVTSAEGRLQKTIKLVNADLFESSWFGPKMWKSKLYDGGIYALGKCVQMRYNEITRAWYGLVAGLLLWFAVNTSGRLGESVISIEVEAVMLLLAVLVIATLWKTVFPLGLRFLAFVFLVDWTLRFWVGIHAFLAESFEFFQWSYYLTGFIALSALIFFLMWMFLRAESRIHHLWAAVGVWFCTLMVMIVFFRMPV
jgi:hypothetical protein